MNCTSCAFWFLYVTMWIILVLWLAHSTFLMTYPRNFNVYWNVFSSIFVVTINFLGHALHFLKSSKKAIFFDALLIIFLIFIGPVLLTLTLVGTITDSINYDQEFCLGGCVINIQAISIFFRILHYIILYIISIFGLALGSLYLYFICFSRGHENRLLKSVFIPREKRGDSFHKKPLHERLMEKSPSLELKGITRTSSF
ncbi:hypothetical protein SteCoe_13091 [Stentor coeruleus]|uniref:Uncharacterized protein n=1 Tax=Stentor coeruleus TaxID=5963 RepID=A0A1R2C991_9CILI|nr:hypothetical protein SteCoe_13091 [Stentor coeruleus]